MDEAKEGIKGKVREKGKGLCCIRDDGRASMGVKCIGDKCDDYDNPT